MSRPLQLILVVTSVLLWSGRSSRAQVKLTPPCDESGLLAWGQFSDGRAVPYPFKSNCDGTVGLTGVANASIPAVNQVAAFSTGRGVAINGNVNWSSGGSVMLPFPSSIVLPVQVWVLFISKGCDFSCVETKMDYFLIWANDRLNAERTGIQLTASGAGWVSDQTALAATDPVKSLVNFSEDGTDCATVRDAFPAGIKKKDALNIYVIRTERGTNHRGIFCSDARDMGFANAFVAYQATNSTILHELSHNLGLSHSAADLNVMNQAIQDGVFYTEGQSFHMNFSRSSALNISIAPRPASEQRNCENTRPPEGCPAAETWIWSDP
jgi:hypothetical protein